MLSKAKIASLADLSPSIVKYYMENYKEFFVPHTVEGSPHPVYDEEAVEVVKHIRELTQQNKNREQIKDLLKGEGYHPVVDMIEALPNDRQPVVNHSPPMVGQPVELLKNLQSAQSAVSALTQLMNDYEEIVVKQEKILARRRETIAENDARLAKADAIIVKQKQQIAERETSLKKLYNILHKTELGKMVLEQYMDKEAV